MVEYILRQDEALKKPRGRTALALAQSVGLRLERIVRRRINDDIAHSERVLQPR
jgi:hypothetical protein